MAFFFSCWPERRVPQLIKWRLTVCSLGVLLSAGCEPQDARVMDPAVLPAELERFTTGAAAQNLDTTGRFVLADVPERTGVPAISRERAGDLAAAFVRTWGRFYKEEWQREHGGPIDLTSLEVDPRIFYAESPYGRFPVGYHPAFRRMFGPWYVVTLASAGNPVLRVAVSAFNTDIGIDSEGKLIHPLLGGTDFQALAISSGSAGWFKPLSPEQAVAHIGLRTGARTAAPPQLTLRFESQFPVHPADAVWKLSLDRVVRVRSSRGRGSVEAREIYVGADNKLYMPAAQQPRAKAAAARRYDRRGQPIGSAVVEVPVKPGGITDFEEVNPLAEQ